MEGSLVSAWIAGGSSVAGAIVWLARLEGKVNTIETVTSSWHDDLKDRLLRIEDKIDKIVERL